MWFVVCCCTHGAGASLNEPPPRTTTIRGGVRGVLSPALYTYTESSAGTATFVQIYKT